MRILMLVGTLATFALADVMIEDFNDAYKGQTTMGQKLGPAAKAGYWYGYDDWNHGAAGLGTKGTPDVVHSDTNFKAAVADDCGEGSPCLHVKYVGGTGYAYPFSAVGFNFLTEGKDVDLSTLTGISFRAKGKGQFRFKLMTKHITDDFDKSNYWADMGMTIRLTTAWKTFTFDTSDIMPQSGAPLADTVVWEQCMDHVRKIHLATPPTFKARDTLDLWIDDIKFYGVTPAAFGGTWAEDTTSTGVSVQKLSNPIFVEHRSGQLSWNPMLVRGVELVGLDGKIRLRTDGRAGRLSLAGMPSGTSFVRFTTVSGEKRTERIVEFR